MFFVYEKLRKESGNKITHPGKDLPTVMEDVFLQYPEESFYFLNEGRLKETAQIFQERFLPDDPRSRIAYAVKANPHPAVLRILTEAGINAFDCASIGEIEEICEVSPEAEIFFNNPKKKRKEIHQAVLNNVGHFTADLRTEVEKILSVCEGQISPEIAVRIKTLNPEGAMINLSEKFGALFPEAQGLFHQIGEAGATPGISMNVGSQVLDMQSYRKNFIQLLELIQSIKIRVSTVNIGGGIPVLQENSFAENQILLQKYLQEMTQIFHNKIDQILLDSEDAKIIIEPGRSMIAPSVDLGISIISTHAEKGEDRLFIDDGVFTSFSESVIHDWTYYMKGIDRKGKEILGEKREYVLEGRTCDSGDRIQSQLLVGGLTSDDYLHVPNAGAYLSSQAAIKFMGYRPHRYVLYNS